MLLKLLKLLLQLLGQGLIAGGLSLLQSSLSLFNLLLQLHNLNLLGVDLLPVHSAQGLHHRADIAAIAHPAHHGFVGETRQVTRPAHPGNAGGASQGRASQQRVGAAHRSELGGAHHQGVDHSGRLLAKVSQLIVRQGALARSPPPLTNCYRCKRIIAQSPVCPTQPHKIS